MGTGIGKAPQPAVQSATAGIGIDDEEPLNKDGFRRRSSVMKVVCKEAVRGTEGYNDREDIVMSTFSSWDKSGDGTIQAAELKQVLDNLNLNVEPKVIRTLLDEMDIGRDGKISIDDFLRWVLEPPSLKLYFDRVQELYDNLTRRLDAFEALQQDNDGVGLRISDGEQDALVAQAQKHAAAELRPLISKLFDFHDTDNNGFLDKEESIIMFGNIVDQLLSKPESVQAFVGLAACTSFEKVLRRAVERWLGSRDFSPQALISIEAELLDEIETERWKLSHDEERQKRAFAKAFRVLDKNGNHQLERDEVIACLLPSLESQNRRFMAALGIMPTDDMLEKLAGRKTEEVLKKLTTTVQAHMLVKAQDQWAERFPGTPNRQDLPRTPTRRNHTKPAKP